MTIIPTSLPAKIYRFLSKSPHIQKILNFLIKQCIPKKKKIPEGIIFLNKSDVGVSGPLAFGMYEKAELKLFREKLKPNMIVIDIGANIGLYTIVAARRVGPHGKIFAYEPEKTNFELLKQNIKINGFNNVIAINKALTNKIGKNYLHLDKHNKGSHSLAPNIDTESMVTIDTDTLDHSLEDYNSPTISIIKMDIEGAEYLAWQGMQQTITRSHNIKIFTEFYPEALKRVSGRSDLFLASLKKTGFDLNIIGEKNISIKIENTEKFVLNFPKNQKFVNIYAEKYSNQSKNPA